MTHSDCEICHGAGALGGYLPQEMICPECKGEGYMICGGIIRCYSCQGLGTIFEGQIEYFPQANEVPQINQ
jgi:DnaJ-class molecular chaperone